MKNIKSLQRGSKIAIISPSNGLPSLFPANYQLGIENLKKEFGFEIIEMPTSRMEAHELYFI